MMGTGQKQGADRRGSAAVLLALAFPALVLADAAGEVAAEAALLSPVTVTAQKRPQPLRDVPLAIDVVAADRLDARGVRSLSDLQRVVPALQIMNNTSIKTIYLRGVGGGGRNAGFDTRAGVYLDGVYVGTPPAADLMLLDLLRVEVLRGPQGDLYGQNTVSGAINLVTQPPSEVFEGRLLAAYGNYDSLRTAVSMDAPLAPSAKLRLAGSWRQREGYIDNLTRDEKVGALEDAAGRARLRLTPSDDLSVELSADYADQRADKVGGEARSGPFGAAMPLPREIAAAYVVDDNLDERDRYENGGAAATIEYDFGQSWLTSISAWRGSTRSWTADVDHSGLDVLGLDYRDDYRSLSQELRLASKAPARRGRYVLGLYLSTTEAENDRLLSGGAQSSLIGLDPSRPQTLSSLAQVDTDVYALFGHYDYALSPTWSLQAGARVEHARKDLVIDQQAQGQAGLAFGAATLDDHRDSREETAFMPSLGLMWHFSEQATLYSRYARGSKSGGFNADFITENMLAAGLEFQDETVDDYELGLKALLLDDRLLLDLALFLAEYRDYQVSQFVPVPGSDPPTITPSLTNAGKVRSYGPELTLSAAPTSRLQIDLALAWLHSDYESFKDGGGEDVDYDGHRSEYAPRFSLTASARYAVPLAVFGGSEGYLEPSWCYRSRQYSNAANTDTFELDSHSLIDLRIGLRTRDRRWDLSLFGQNLADETYDLGTSLDALTTVYGPYGMPRTYGVEVRYHWF